MGRFQRGCSGLLGAAVVPDWWAPLVGAGHGVRPRDVNSLQKLQGQPSCPEASMPSSGDRGPGAPLQASPPAGGRTKAKVGCSLKPLVLSAPGLDSSVLGGTGATPCVTVTCPSDVCARESRAPCGARAAVWTPVRGGAPRCLSAERGPAPPRTETSGWERAGRRRVASARAGSTDVCTDPVPKPRSPGHGPAETKPRSPTQGPGTRQLGSCSWRAARKTCAAQG